MHNKHKVDRRCFLKATAVGLVMAGEGSVLAATPTQIVEYPRVSITRCLRYKFEDIKTKLAENFDLIGGIQSLVRNKTMTIKVNITSATGMGIYTLKTIETVYTHPLVTLAACSLFQDYGAKKIVIVESLPLNLPTKDLFNSCGYDTKLFESMVPIVEFENTRNKGTGSGYKTMPVGDQPYAYTSFDLNYRYYDTDVFVSIPKMKNHDICGITLSMKNLFGITPNALYADPGNENATLSRGILHDGSQRPAADGEILPVLSKGNPGARIPRIVVDLNRARPIDLAIFDGILSMSGGEGNWNGRQLGITAPGLLVASRNCLCADAVGASLMGYDPMAPGWSKPFLNADNTLQLAAGRWLGTNDLSQIEVVGLSIDDTRFAYLPGKKN